MKYIMIEVEGKTGKRRVPIIFPNFLIRSYVAEAIKEVLKLPGQGIDKVLEVESAGDATVFGIECSGNSSSLKIPSFEGDADFITLIDYNHGYF